MVKLFQLLRKLSVKETNQLEECLTISLFNKRTDVRRLMEYWLNHPKNTEKEAAFAFVYPGKKFNSRDWHLLTSRLFKLGELFLANKEFLECPTQQKLFLGKAYRKKKMTPFFQTVYRENKKLLKQQELRNGNWLQEYFQTEDQYYDFVASHDRKSRTNLQEVSHGLDYYFFANKLKTACLALSRQTINQEKYEVHLLEEVIDFIENHPPFLEQPAINVYYHCYKAITETENEKWFTQLRESITQHQRCFPPSERRDIFMLATNYCIRRLNTGNPAYIREALELYRLSLSAGYLLEDGIIPESTFGNIVSLAAFLKEFDWAENFVLENQKFLKPVFQQPLYFYSLGRLHYEQGRYDQSLKCLIQVDSKANFLIIGAKTLQLKIYFEQKEIDALESLLESFRVYLQRKKDLGYHKKNYERLILYIKKLLDLPAKSKAAALQLKSEVNAVKGFTEKKWILDKIEELM